MEKWPKARMAQLGEEMWAARQGDVWKSSHSSENELGAKANTK